MLPLGLFRRRNFAVGNLATLLFYGALNTVTFFLVVFLQQVAGYSPIGAGLALMPLPVLTFLLAKRFGALADRLGPRLFMGVGRSWPAWGCCCCCASTLAPTMRRGIVLFGLGLAMTVAPLTAAVLGAVDSGRSGIASGVNNAIARVAGLVAIAAVGAAVAGHFSSSVEGKLGGTDVAPAPLHQAAQRPFVIDLSAFTMAQRPAARRALVSASVGSYRLAITISGALAIFSGLLSLGAISNRKTAVAAADCPGGALVGASSELVASRPEVVTS
jgi:hypothetical protein